MWAGCDFDDACRFARDRQSGQLWALVGVSITFALPEPMTRRRNAGRVHHDRQATAVFRFDGAQWTTDGRAVFNLNPTETIRRYQSRTRAGRVVLRTASACNFRSTVCRMPPLR